MMQRVFGNIPLPPSPSLEVGNAAAKLKSLATYGGIVTDTMSDTMVQYLNAKIGAQVFRQVSSRA